LRRTKRRDKCERVCHFDDVAVSPREKRYLLAGLTMGRKHFAFTLISEKILAKLNRRKREAFSLGSRLR
jgi:hypothetical protein